MRRWYRMTGDDLSTGYMISFLSLINSGASFTFSNARDLLIT
jgi:hypothetical protein